MAALHRRPAVITHRLGDLPLLAPQKFTETVLAPADRVVDVRRDGRRLELAGRHLERVS
jgi:hypothetical protein